MVFCEVCWVIIGIGAILGTAFLFFKHTLSKQYKTLANEYYGINAE